MFKIIDFNAKKKRVLFPLQNLVIFVLLKETIYLNSAILSYNFIDNDIIFSIFVKMWIMQINKLDQEILLDTT